MDVDLTDLAGKDRSESAIRDTWFVLDEVAEQTLVALCENLRQGGHERRLAGGRRGEQGTASPNRIDRAHADRAARQAATYLV